MRWRWREHETTLLQALGSCVRLQLYSSTTSYEEVRLCVLKTMALSLLRLSNLKVKWFQRSAQDVLFVHDEQD